MKSSRSKVARSSLVPARSRRLRRSFLLAMGVLVGSVLAAVYAPGLWKQRVNEQQPKEPPKTQQKEATSAKETPPITPVAASPYKNTQPGVQYVGSKACIVCHEQEHESYQHTGMAKSMATVELSREPADGAFDHPLSKSRYEVRRKDGQMWHRELLLTGGDEEVLLQEYPVKYVTGSGRHSLTYLVEDDGFLMESPITWYTSRKAWGMSPGYDRANHSGFEREVGETCLVCHAGQIKAEGKSLHRMTITEAAIGCEQCHGPGELHIQRQKSVATHGASQPAANDFDDTIVNPARLTRELSEAVCQQCHLRGSAAVFAKGKTPFDFRPGLPLGEFVQHYELETPNRQMSVVGHVEQMHQSKCYQETKTFSCLTCHGPHGEPAGEELTKHYIQVCTSCHQPEACRVNPERRQKESPENNCLACHMPQTPTDIPHLAFTHHRIGIHDSSPGGESDSKRGDGTDSFALRPMFEISPGSDSEQKRSLGLAYLEVANKEEVSSRRLQYQQRAISLLSEARAAGGADGTVDAWLARLRFEFGMPDAHRYAQSALSDPELAGQDLCHALFLLADAQFQQKRYADALQTLEQLGKLRRHSMQWLLMAQCQKEVGNEAATEQALLKAVHINPRLTKIQQKLAEIYRQKGNESRARYHEMRAVP
ncbi:MAG: cytochrome c3 family protein [Pirellulaceae bacterium]